jgi:hypothetical protein
MLLVTGVRWSFRGEDAGSPKSQSYFSGASSAARWHSEYFAKPS